MGTTVRITPEFYEEIIALLSGNLVDVELDEADVLTAYKQAKRTYKQRGSDNLDPAFTCLTVKPGQNVYQLQDDITDVIEILRGRSSESIAADPFTMSAFQEMFSPSYQHGGDNFFVYDLTRQVLDNNEAYLANEPNFRFNRRFHTLTIFNPPSIEQRWMLEVYKEMTDRDYQNELWIINWTVAECKQMLGRAYRKMGTLPGPAGETQVDGDQLVQESQQEKERLLEDIDNFVDGEPDGMAVFIG